MTSEKTGADRTLKKYRGDLGELEVVREFLDLGCAVNSLTSADYTLDLHVQIPKEAALTRGATWQMSGLVAHVQVKASGKSHAPQVKDWQLRSWAAGTAVGTPTFVFFVDTVRELKYVSTPWHLQRRLDDLNGAEAPSLGDDYRMVYDPELFQHLLQLWCRHAALMLRLGIEGIPARVDSIKKDMRDGEQEEDAAGLPTWRDALADNVGLLVHTAIWDRESTAQLSSVHVAEVEKTTAIIASNIGLDDPAGFGVLAAEWLTSAVQPGPLGLQPWQMPQPSFRMRTGVDISEIARHLEPCFRMMFEEGVDTETSE